MKVTTHERPGVYSVYEASSLISGVSGAKWVGLAAICTTGTAGISTADISAAGAAAALKDRR